MAGSSDLVMGYDPGLAHRGLVPFAEGRVVEHGVHVGPDPEPRPAMP